MTVTPKCLDGSPVDRYRFNARLGTRRTPLVHFVGNVNSHCYTGWLVGVPFNKTFQPYKFFFQKDNVETHIGLSRPDLPRNSWCLTVSFGSWQDRYLTLEKIYSWAAERKGCHRSQTTIIDK
ncbi:hypothetical protein TNCV_418231 [Trichonephila clavipes]|nr:hypothetical protein TNCV_418231 [Trichonephila clavipes]